jgi:hypothetical protein
LGKQQQKLNRNAKTIQNIKTKQYFKNRRNKQKFQNKKTEELSVQKANCRQTQL